MENTEMGEDRRDFESDLGYFFRGYDLEPDEAYARTPIGTYYDSDDKALFQIERSQDMTGFDIIMTILNSCKIPGVIAYKVASCAEFPQAIQIIENRLTFAIEFQTILIDS